MHTAAGGVVAGEPEDDPPKHPAVVSSSGKTMRENLTSARTVSRPDRVTGQHGLIELEIAWAH